MREIHKDDFMKELEDVINKIGGRVQSVECNIKKKLFSYRCELEKSNELINFPKYESLMNAKKYHLKKLVEKT